MFGKLFGSSTFLPPMPKPVELPRMPKVGGNWKEDFVKTPYFRTDWSIASIICVIRTMGLLDTEIVPDEFFWEWARQYEFRNGITEGDRELANKIMSVYSAWHFMKAEKIERKDLADRLVKFWNLCQQYIIDNDIIL